MYREVIALLKTHCLDDAENKKLLFAIDEKDGELYPRGADTTAAGATLFAMLNRFFGYDGGAAMPGSVPSLKEEPSMQPLLRWFERVEKETPVQFKGKREPKDSRRGSAESVKSSD